MPFKVNMSAAGPMVMPGLNFLPFTAAAAVNKELCRSRRWRDADCPDWRRGNRTSTVRNHHVAARPGGGHHPATVSKHVSAAWAVPVASSHYDVTRSIPVVSTPRTAHMSVLHDDHLRRRHGSLVVVVEG